jgi:hypothetical protein
MKALQLAILLSVSLFVTSCNRRTAENTTVSAQSREQECASYGLAPGSDGYKSCVSAAPSATRTQATTAGASKGDGWTHFTDPTENAFTVSVPEGWKVKGGIVRKSAVVAIPWFAATSPDGATSVFMGDPTVPLFTLPTQRLREGAVVNGVTGPQSVEPYQDGGQFAAQYGQRYFAASCAGLQLKGAQPEPAVAQRAQADTEEMRARVGDNLPVTTTYDGGSALFTCQVGGKAYTATTIVATALTRIGDGGLWSVPTVFGYRTPAERQTDVDRLARAMQASFQKNPQWEQKMADVARGEIARIKQEGEAFAAQQQGRHDAFMGQMNAQQASRNAAFADHMYQKGVGQQREMLYIQNRHCVQWYDAAHTNCRYYAQD